MPIIKKLEDVKAELLCASKKLISNQKCSSCGNATMKLNHFPILIDLIVYYIESASMS